MAETEGMAEIPGGEEPGGAVGGARRAAEASLATAVRRETRLSLAFLSSAAVGLLAAAAVSTPAAHRLMAWASDPEESAITGEASERPVMFLGCLGFFLGALFLVERRRRVVFEGVTTDDPVLCALGADRARAARTHAPHRVCVALQGGVVVEDRLATFGRRVERVLVVSAAYLPSAGAGDLAKEIDEQLLPVRGTGHLGAAARARAAYLATSLTNWTSPQSDQERELSLAFRVVEVFGRAPLWVSTLPLRAPLLRAIADRQRATAALGVLDAGARRATRGRTARDELLAAYSRTVLRPLTSFGIFLRDPLVGFERWRSGEPQAEESADRSRARGGALDGLAKAYGASLDHIVRNDLAAHTCAAVVEEELERAIQAHAQHVTEALALRRKKTSSAARTFCALVEGLSRGEGAALMGRVRPALLADVSVRGGLRYNHALARALGSTLAAALLDRGGSLLDPFAAKTIAIELDGAPVDVFAIVDEALSKASGAAALDRWVERLSNADGAEPVGARRSLDKPSAEDSAEHDPLPSRATQAETTPAVAVEPREPSAAVRRSLSRANERVTRSATYLVFAFALCSVLALPLGYATVWLLHELITQDEGSAGPLAPTLTCALSVMVVGIAVAAAYARAPRRSTLDREPSKRLERLVNEAAARHDTHGPSIFEIVEDRADLPQVELTDHTDWFLGAADRHLVVSEVLTRKSAAAELEQQLDLAFATVAGTDVFAANVRGRASCLRALDGRIGKMPDEPSQWFVVLAFVRMSSFLLAIPGVHSLAGFEQRTRQKLAAAMAAYGARWE